jgi:phosphatidate cytidylyltransferase
VRSRAISSVFVVIVALAAVIVGGPVFALFFVCVCATGYREYLQLVHRIEPSFGRSIALVGYGAIVGFGLAALIDGTTETLFAVAAISVAAPLSLLLLHPNSEAGFSAWALTSAGSLYLGIPVYAAIRVRSIPGSINATWITELEAHLSVGRDVAPRGLAWALMVILVIWVGDTAAYGVGRAWGTNKLAPRLSPNKTVEGAAAGLLGSIVVSALTFQSTGLGTWWLGSIIGGVIGAAGQLGDLAESFLKRQVGVKDSGAAIPGHGGILDRIDALLFAFPVGFVIAAGFERIAS